MATKPKPSTEHRVNVNRYDSPGALLHRLKSADTRDCLPGSHRADWAGASYPDVREWAVTGSPVHAERVASIMAGIESVMPTTDRPDVQASMIPGYVCVADALTGAPDAFRRRVMTADDTAPVRFIVDLSVWSDVDEQVIARRGAALCAAIQNIIAHRPVTLEVMCGYRFNSVSNVTGVTVIDVDPRSMDLQMLAFTLACPGFLRLAMFDAARADNKADMDDSLPRGSRSTYLPALHPGADTITIDPLWSHDDCTPFASEASAAAWATGMVRRALEASAAEHDGHQWKDAA